MNNRKIPPIIGVKAKSKYQALLLLSSRHLIVKDKLGISFINEYKRYITQLPILSKTSPKTKSKMIVFILKHDLPH